MRSVCLLPVRAGGPSTGAHMGCRIYGGMPDQYSSRCQEYTGSTNGGSDIERHSDGGSHLPLCHRVQL